MSLEKRWKKCIDNLSPHIVLFFSLRRNGRKADREKGVSGGVWEMW